MSADAQPVGFVGVGRMGGPMAGRLLDAGYALTVFDANADAMQPLVARGAAAAASPADVAARAPIVLMSLPTPGVVQAVALGDGGLAKGTAVKTVVDLSTSGPGMANTVAKGLAAHGITLV